MDLEAEEEDKKKASAINFGKKKKSAVVTINPINQLKDEIKGDARFRAMYEDLTSQ